MQRRPDAAGSDERPATFEVGGATLHGDLSVPERPTGLVVFAHGSGSSRFSPRNRFVAARLQRAGLATLLIDLLTDQEADEDRLTGSFRFDIELLTARLIGIAELLRDEPQFRRVTLGLFGASTGGGAALLAAARRPDLFGAVVSRGGRPDLAGEALGRVRAPTLLIIGGEDHAILPLNRAALARLAGEGELRLVPGATHLFEEPGALERVADLAADWFSAHLGAAPGAGSTGTGG